MTPDRTNGRPFREELLAAYADGELAGAERRAVEAWLARDPEAAAAAEAQGEVCRFARTYLPPEPDDGAWERTFAAVGAGLAVAAFPPTGRVVAAHKARAVRPTWRKAAVRRGAFAAAVLVVLTLNPLAPRELTPRPAVKPLPVAAAEDVDIITLHAADADRLVVGVAPVRDPLVLAAPGDVVVVSIKPDADGTLPYLRIHPENSAPMVVVPQDGEPPE